MVVILAISSGYLLGQRLRSREFVQACQAKMGSGASDFCRELEAVFFTAKEVLPVHELAPYRVGAQERPVDSQLRITVFRDPRYFAAYAYCYSVFRKAVDPASVQPDRFAGIAGGFSFNRAEAKEFSDWLKSETGSDCRKRVHDSLGLQAVDVSREMEGKLALIALNPLAWLERTAEAPRAEQVQKLIERARRTLEHEREAIPFLLKPEDKPLEP